MSLLLAAALLAAPAAETQAAPRDPHDLLCSVPYKRGVIPADDPARALFEEEGQSAADVGVRIAIERANSCDDEFLERLKAMVEELRTAIPQDDARRHLVEVLADAVYEIETDGEFVCDDHPERCEDAILVDSEEWDAIVLRLCGPNGSISRDDQGPVCDWGRDPVDDCPIDDVGGYERCEARRP